MEIKLLGVELLPGDGLTLAELFTHIEQAKGTPIEVAKYGRFAYVADIGDYFAGLLITTKDQKKYLEFTHDAENAKLEAKDVTEGANLADFNFFLIAKKSGRGIYQYYHTSCSLNTFGVVCRRFYDALKADRIRALMDAEAKLTGKREAEIRRQFAGTLKWNILVRPESFEKLVRELKSIGSVTVSLTTMAYQKTIFSPLAKHARRIVQSFKFADNLAKDAMIGDLAALVENPELETARVEGKDEQGHTQVIKLVNNPDAFGMFDYDSVAEHMTLSPNDFANSPFMKELLKVAEKKKELFQ